MLSILGEPINSAATCKDGQCGISPVRCVKVIHDFGNDIVTNPDLIFQGLIGHVQWFL